MAEYLSAEYFAELRAAEQRPGNHKAEWSEDALIILEEFATAKVQGRGGACGRILPYVQKIIPLLEVEPRGEPPDEYLRMVRRKGVDLRLLEVFSSDIKSPSI